ncbi:MAG: SDR family NAD(P)-dependent oxidoreductase [Chloroflexi bacterium]|nr:SDR family NAD(P)-dependent oxidoreductase [Chloroflexota bacterium]
MADLRSRIALVTGASRGIGRGIAHELGIAGATVYISGRSVSDDETTEQLGGNVHGTAALVTESGGTGIAVRCDHTNDSEVEGLFERIQNEQGKLDILVNNVWGGYERFGDHDFSMPFWKQPMSRWSLMFDAGVRAHYVASCLAVPLMIPQGSGLIVNISAGDNGKYRGWVMYDAAKEAVDRMAFALAQELQSHGITALALYPGLTRTERVMRYSTPEELASSESPRYAGRAVVSLATDRDVMRRSGNAYKTGELAREYGFTDIDGRQPPPFTFG